MSKSRGWRWREATVIQTTEAKNKRAEKVQLSGNKKKQTEELPHCTDEQFAIERWEAIARAWAQRPAKQGSVRWESTKSTSSVNRLRQNMSSGLLMNLRMTYGKLGESNHWEPGFKLRQKKQTMKTCDFYWPCHLWQGPLCSHVPPINGQLTWSNQIANTQIGGQFKTFHLKQALRT